MDKATLFKYAAAGVLLGAIGSAEYMGHAPSGSFYNLALAALTALGVHSIKTGGAA